MALDPTLTDEELINQDERTSVVKSDIMEVQSSDGLSTFKIAFTVIKTWVNSLIDLIKSTANTWTAKQTYTGEVVVQPSVNANNPVRKDELEVEKERITELDSEVVKKTGDQHIDGDKTFIGNIRSETPASDDDELMRKAEHDFDIDRIDSEVVKKEGEQTISGKKKFDGGISTSATGNTSADLNINTESGVENAGDINIQPGVGNENAGATNISGGNGSFEGKAGNVNISGGDGANDSEGGDVVISGGAGHSGEEDGKVIFPKPPTISAAATEPEHPVRNEEFGVIENKTRYFNSDGTVEDIESGKSKTIGVDGNQAIVVEEDLVTINEPMIIQSPVNANNPIQKQAFDNLAGTGRTTETVKDAYDKSIDNNLRLSSNRNYFIGDVYSLRNGVVLSKNLFEIEVLKVISQLEIEYIDEDKKDEIWVINAFSNDYSNPSFQYYLSLKNLNTGNSESIAFDAGELAAGYAEFTMSSTGWIGGKVKIWFDYSQTSETGLLISSSASEFNIETKAIRSINEINNVKAIADTAETNAQQGISDAAIADGKAVAAQATADSAQSSADAAQSTADSAQSSADAAQSTADSAQSSADTAQATADSAQSSANNNAANISKNTKAIESGSCAIAKTILENPDNDQIEVSNSIEDVYFNDYIQGREGVYLRSFAYQWNTYELYLQLSDSGKTATATYSVALGDTIPDIIELDISGLGTNYDKCYVQVNPSKLTSTGLFHSSSDDLLMRFTDKKRTSLDYNLNTWFNKRIIGLGTSVLFGQYATKSYFVEAANRLGYNYVNAGSPGLAIHGIDDGSGGIKPRTSGGSSVLSIAEYAALGTTIESSPLPYTPGGSYNNHYITWENIFKADNQDGDLYLYAVAPNNTIFDTADWEDFDKDAWAYNTGTFEDHRKTFLGALIFMVNKMYTFNPNARMVFVLDSLFRYDDGKEAFETFANEFHIPIINLYGKLNENAITKGGLWSESGTNPHPSTFAHELMGKVLSQELLLIS